jgi:ribosomal protein S18 acetylase RimI-like enzyme
MPTYPYWTLRTANQSDRETISTLLSSAQWKHQHLDWINALDLIGEAPFLLALEHGLVVGCLACPPDPPTVAWLRLFAVASDYTPSHLWGQLWPEASVQAVSAGATQAAILLSSDWLAPLLLQSGFKHTNDVIFLECHGDAPPLVPLERGHIRLMRSEDLPIVAEIDRRSFNLIWQHSLDILRKAVQLAAISTVIECDGQPVGYQVSTASIYSGHLARLAVAPEWQGHGMGKALVSDLLHRFNQRGMSRVSVNTQADNEQSLQIYQRLGFHQTGSRYPVYQIELPPW